MKNYIGIDGLVLCVMGGKIDVKRWISSIDMFDHSIISYEELINSVNNLLIFVIMVPLALHVVQDCYNFCLC